MVVRELICEAIRSKRLLRFSYGNHTRVVEPHLFGRDSADHDVLSAYLVRGYSESRQKPYWRFYLLSDVKLLYNARRDLFWAAQRLQPERSADAEALLSS